MTCQRTVSDDSMSLIFLIFVSLIYLLDGAYEHLYDVYMYNDINVIYENFSKS